jgi:integrase
MSKVLVDAAGRRRSPATMPGFHAGVRRGTKVAVTQPILRRSPRSSPSSRQAGDDLRGRRLRGLVVVLWRAGLRIHEALALKEADLDPRRGSVLVRRGKGGRRRQVGMDDWAWEQLEPWLKVRVDLPVGPLFCVISGPTRGRVWSTAAARAQLRETAARSGVRDASRPTNSGTHTPSRWLVKVCLCL